MTSQTTKPDSSQPAAEMAVDLCDNWFDPIETAVRARAREFIEELIRGELDTVLARPRYGRSQMAGDEASADVTDHRHGSRTRSLTGTFGSSLCAQQAGFAERSFQKSFSSVSSPILACNDFTSTAGCATP